MFDILEGMLKCQDCYARNTELIQDPETHRLICKDRELCAQVEALEFNREP
jgi:hypothetical protein